MADFEVPIPPFIPIPGIPNFRDVGGYSIASAPGKVIKRGVAFRSSEPSKVTDEGVAKLQELKITVVYDLRSRREMDKDAQEGHGRQAKEWEGAKRIFAPVLLDEAYSPEAIALRVKKYGDKSSEVSAFSLIDGSSVAVAGCPRWEWPFWGKSPCTSSNLAARCSPHMEYREALVPYLGRGCGIADASLR
jgi:hypothetical protein